LGRSDAIVKISVVCDQPFWRADGLSGQTASPGSLATLTIDACTDTGTPRVMCVITEGPAARRLGRLAPADRQAAVVGELVDRFGDRAGSPAGYHEQERTVERYSGGGMISHAPTGVLTEFGYTLCEPCGRIRRPGRRARPSCADGSTAPSALGSAPRKKCWPAKRQRLLGLFDRRPVEDQ